jgi:hypothetical protein
VILHEPLSTIPVVTSDSNEFNPMQSQAAE